MALSRLAAISQRSRAMHASTGSLSNRLAHLKTKLLKEPKALVDFQGKGSSRQGFEALEAVPSGLSNTGAGDLAPLTDSFGRVHTYLRLSITERCNLRCQYCMPHEGIDLTPQSHLTTDDEQRRLLAIFIRLGITKIRLTGGEPTLRRDLPALIASLRGLSDRLQTLAMTTNGVLLQPMLPALREAGLTHLNISLDTLQRDKFERISRRPAAHWNRTRSAIDAALAAGYSPLKVNCVVMRGVNDGEISDFVRLTESLPIQVRFIELMPFAGNDWKEAAFVPMDEQIRIIKAAYSGFAPAEASDPSFVRESSETASLWRVPGHAGCVGFISSMSDAFCGTCNRLRLTADGQLKVCLHSNTETSLLKMLRDGQPEETVIDAIRAAVRGKHFALGGKDGRRGLAEASKEIGARPMIKIGG